LGCGIGFWVAEFAMLGYKNLYAADLTEDAIKITKKRLEIYNYKVNSSVRNAENLDFENETFNHFNCQGVIRHTPNTDKYISEISRILKSNVTANIFVYYRNSILRFWKMLRYLYWPLSLFGGGLKGLGRYSIFKEKNVDEIVRLYDGKDKPIGKSYTKSSFVKILESHFLINETYLHFFIVRVLPFKIPVFIHK
jgi:ubiquinone/menaquinone biosynthesis C-methylase UbiE